jgi:hypothetical protein
MCYEAAIASVGGDEVTLSKSLIISLEDAAANWYSRLPPGCIHSWQQLKKKFMLNLQVFQAELNIEEDFFCPVPKEKKICSPIFTGDSCSRRLKLRKLSKPSVWGPAQPSHQGAAQNSVGAL